MNPIELIAAFVSIVVVARIGLLVFNRKPLQSLRKWLYANMQGAQLIVGLGTVVLGYYVLQYYSIVEVMAITGFVVGLLGWQMLCYQKGMKALVDDFLRRPVALPTYAFLVLALWALKELFM